MSESAPAPPSSLLACPICDYDVSASKGDTCAECGYQWTQSDVLRSSAKRLRNQRIRKNLALICGATVLAAIATMVLIADLFTALVVVTVMAAVPLGSVGVGLLVARLATRQERAAWGAAWLSVHLWLLLPIGVMMCGLLMGAFLSIVGSDQGALMEGAFFGTLLLSCASTIFGIVVFVIAWRRQIRRYQLVDRTAKVYFPLVAFLLCLALPWLMIAVVFGSFRVV